MKHLPLVSVVMPVYNNERFISESILSALNQSHRNIEIIVVDDGSTDLSAKKAEAFGEKVRVVTQKNSGAAAARNRGVLESQGEFVAFLDSDDIWEPEKLESQLKNMKDFRWSYTDAIFYGGINDGLTDSHFTKKYDGVILDKIITCNFIGTSSVLLTKELFLEAGGFDESLRSIQDWDFWCRVSAICAVKHISEPLVKYRVHSSSISRNARKNIVNHIKVIEKIFGQEGPGSHFTHLKRVAKYNSYSIVSHIAEEENDYLFSFFCRSHALKCQPLKPEAIKSAIKSLIKLPLAMNSIFFNTIPRN
ncbi:glycosyltransferase [Marinobacter salinisoli]|uniref:Glycosyltransferase n=1 Tax=Marinobacter salinisoli TaxID=2769486 RepID=A0ABX7MQ60_9GAMM|nr:glycosyltransferase [Marinobacter salinisoli]QSP93524.1 glycosyltransferase [Marinobacter salinisoli]